MAETVHVSYQKSSAWTSTLVHVREMLIDSIVRVDKYQVLNSDVIDSEQLVDAENNQVRLSSISKWYKQDFDGRTGVVAFLLDHLPDDHRRIWLEQHADSAHLVCSPYDWFHNG